MNNNDSHNNENKNMNTIDNSESEILNDSEKEKEIIVNITNKNKILSLIDNEIYNLQKKEGCDDIKSPKAPSVEYLFVEPFGSFRIFGSFGFGLNPYGHAAVRYTIPETGEEKIVNISGTNNDNLVNFYTPEEYLFENTDTADQGGIFNRNIVSIRIENVEPWQIEDMDYYFKKLQRKNRKQQSKFSIIFSPFYNMLRWFCNLSSIAERGNCAYFTSSGLTEACLVSFPTLWPKKIWIELFEKQKSKDPSNVHVVYYHRNRNQQGLKYGVDVKYIPFTGVAPLSPIRSFLYKDLEKFADVIVEVPEGSNEAKVIIPNIKPKEPSKLRYNAGSILFGFGLFAFFMSRRGRNSVVKKANNTQEHLKHAIELVNLIKKQRSSLKKPIKSKESESSQ